MKITSLKIHNVGIIEDIDIKLDKALLLFYGEVRQGKTTILNAVRWVCGGAFPADLIRHGQKEAFVEMGFDGGVIRREWYRSKATETKPSEVKAREIQFVRAGKPVQSPASEIKRLLNPFLLNQDHLRNMTELDRKRYFSEMFAVDTTALDTELFNSESKARDMRSEIKGYGEIDLTKVERIDTLSLEVQLRSLKEAHQQQVNMAISASQSAQEHNARFDSTTENLTTIRAEVSDLESRLANAKDRLQRGEDWQKSNPKRKLGDAPQPPPRIAELETAVSGAAAQNVRADQYDKNVKRAEEMKSKQTELTACETRQRAIKAEKIAKLKGVSDTCGIPGLAFDESGDFTFEGTTAGMLSTSQIMKLSSALSSLYPEGLGVELLDRGESLGRSIFDYVDLAKEKKITVLASIVGQRPAKAPPEVGVFVVSDGKVIADEEKS